MRRLYRWCWAGFGASIGLLTAALFHRTGVPPAIEVATLQWHERDEDLIAGVVIIGFTLITLGLLFWRLCPRRVPPDRTRIERPERLEGWLEAARERAEKLGFKALEDDGFRLTMRSTRGLLQKLELSLRPGQAELRLHYPAYFLVNAEEYADAVLDFVAGRREALPEGRRIALVSLLAFSFALPVSLFSALASAAFEPGIGFAAMLSGCGAVYGALFLVVEMCISATGKRIGVIALVIALASFGLCFCRSTAVSHDVNPRAWQTIGR